MVSWLGVSVVALMTGCVVTQEPDNTLLPGTVEVSWQVGPAGCEASGVTDVKVDIGGVGGTFACEDSSAMLSVPPGTYDLSLVGLDETGFARYEGTALNVVVRPEVLTSVPTVVLSALPGEIVVSWYFDNGKLCSSTENKGVVEMEALLYDEDDFQEGEATALCEDGEMLISDVRPGDYTLTLFGRDSRGTITHQGSQDLIMDKGDLLMVEIELVTQ